MMRSLLDRNIATLVVVVLAGQLLAAALLYQLVMRPQTVRLAEVTAEMTDTIGRSMARMSPDERRALVARFNADDAVLIRPGDQPPSVGRRPPTLVENQFLIAIAHRLNHDRPVEWRTDREARLWVHLWLGGEGWWVSLTPRHLRAPLLGVEIALGSALAVAIMGGILLQRTIGRPLRRLVAAVDGFDPQTAGAQAPIDEAGPSEIAAVAHAFNRLAERLAEQDAERAVMLGAVSHDLRTPLTRLRLSLAMMHDADPALRESADRQVDRIDTMLRRILDFARGFEAEAAQPVRLDAAIRAVVEHMGAPEAPELALESGLVVQVPPLALERALANLLGNALRHGAAPYRIEACALGGQVEIAVGDSGAGFDPAQAAALCRAFARGDPARGGEGTGLGLAIAQRFAQACGGTLNFTHRDGLFRAILRVPGAPVTEARVP